MQDVFKLTVPVGYVLVGDTRSDIKHDNGALAANVVSIPKSAKLFLTCCVPNFKDDLAVVL